MCLLYGIEHTVSSFKISNSTDYLHRGGQLAALPGVLILQHTVTALNDSQLTAEAYCFWAQLLTLKCI